jgi:hypothetical protein
MSVFFLTYSAACLPGILVTTTLLRCNAKYGLGIGNRSRAYCVILTKAKSFGQTKVIKKDVDCLVLRGLGAPPLKR